MNSLTPYNEDYPATYLMKEHDGESVLRRWFNNWKIDKYDWFAEATEWLTIEEYSWSVCGKKVWRYVGTIGADHHSRTRTVKFETGAPAPPTFMLPVRKKYEPPPPVPPGYARIMAEREAARQEAMWRYMSNRFFTPQQMFIANVLPPIPPPLPRYRRN